MSVSVHLTPNSQTPAPTTFVNTHPPRLSVSWSRILPQGRRNTPVNAAGVAHYNGVINELLANGIKPFVTMLHCECHDRHVIASAVRNRLHQIGAWAYLASPGVHFACCCKWAVFHVVSKSTGVRWGADLLLV